MKKVIFTLLYLLPFLAASAQDATLKGIVTEEPAEPLMAANVVIDAGKGWAAVTDIDGAYEIKVPAGTYEVSFRYIGKDEQKIKISLVAGENKTLNVLLKERVQMIDVVVVTGSKYEKPLSQETVSMDVLQGQTLTNQNITNLEDGLNRIPSVTVADGQVNIRGGSGWSYGAGSRVLVLIDDLPMLTADAADAKWSIIPMENVDQIEVIKGAASALYGTSALNGIINIRTAYPNDEPYTKFTTYVGIYDGPSRTPRAKWWGNRPQAQYGVNFAERRKIGQVDLTLGGAYDKDMGYNDSSDNQSVRLNAKLRYRVKKVPGLNFGINTSGYISWGKTFFFYKGADSLAYEPYPGTITQYTSYRFTVDPFLDYFDKKDNRFRFRGRFFNATNTNNTGQGSVPNLYYADVQYQRRWDKIKAAQFNFIAGSTFSYSDVKPPAISPASLFGKHTGLNFSAYAQVDAKVIERLNLTFGARWEYIQIDNKNSLKDLPYPLFRIGANYQAAEATYIRASFGQGFRYPTIAERYVSTSVGPLTIASNPELEPEKGYSAEIGLKQGFVFGKDKNWQGFGDVALFWNQYENMMEFTFGQFGDSSYWAFNQANLARNFGIGFSSQNVGKTRILGAEIMFGLQGKVKDWTFSFSGGYTFIDPRALNFNDPLDLKNYQGAKLTTAIYENPDSLNYITYAMTSSSTSNILKYRNRHTVKIDVTVGWKKFELNNNLQYASYMENIDYAFTSAIFKQIGGNAFRYLDQWRNYKESIPIGKGRGDIIWNMGFGYSPIPSVKMNFIIKNALNWEYTPRPASYEAPRSYTLQLSYTFNK
jgi:outer membrane receptor protein involved in Fe transport